MLDKLFQRKSSLVDADSTLPGRDHYEFDVPTDHAVNGNRMQPPFPDGMEVAEFALGCFWGAERLFWQQPGVYSTYVGYTGGVTPYPTYKEVCSGKTNHAETVGVVFDPRKVTYAQLVKTFFEAHDPTQGMKQGGDVGTQYRSAIYYRTPEQFATAAELAKQYDASLRKAGYSAMTTEIAPAGDFYYAEDYHQQYLHKIPGGYCGLAGTGVTCAVGGSNTVKVGLGD